MKKNNLGNVFNNDTIIISDLFKVLFNSKKIIVSITLLCSLLAFYAAQEEPQFESVSIIEVGTFKSSDGKERLIEPLENIIDNLQIDILGRRGTISQQEVKVATLIHFASSTSQCAGLGTKPRYMSRNRLTLFVEHECCIVLCAHQKTTEFVQRFKPQ